MNSQLLSFLPLFFIIKLLILILGSQCSGSPDEFYKSCSASFGCGTIGGIGYPFRRQQDPVYCGYPGLELSCDGSNSPSISIMNITYRLLGFDQSSQILKIVREDMIDSTCPQDLVNTTIAHELFDYPLGYINLTFLFGCPVSFSIPGLNQLSCGGNGVFLLPGDEGPGSCTTSVVIPAPARVVLGGVLNSTGLDQVLREGFEVRWKVDSRTCNDCSQSNGRCIYSYDTSQTTCACPDPPYLSDSCSTANTTRSSSSPSPGQCGSSSTSPSLFTCYCSNGNFSSTCSNSDPGQAASGGHKRIWVIILTIVSVLIGIVYYTRRKIRQRGKEKELLELMTLNGYTEAMATVNNGKKGHDVKDFSYSSIEVATNCFSSENKLGEGGFGPVYKGKLPDGQDIAVKKLSKRSVQGLIEFKTELILIAKLQHTNLVRLFGYCVHRQEKMLIYEYMPNKSLDFFLFDVANKCHLPWERRFNIIVGIAQGLLYLHEHSRLRIVHRDLKASNILLDGNMNPKISDFGLARIFKPNSTSTKTIKIAGTRGYMAPEYLKDGTFSDKSDVFSFGVLVLEIVSSRKANCFYDAEQPMNLITYAWELWYGGAATGFMDPTLAGSCTVPEQLIRCIQIGLLCVQHHASHRPTMSTVVSLLSTPEAALLPPKPPSLLVGDHVAEVMQEDINEVTLSEFNGR